MTIKKHNYDEISLRKHKQKQGKISICLNVPLRTKKQLSTYYTPGVAAPCLEIAKDKTKVRDLVINGKCVAVITDGSAVLGLGNIGPSASLPVMEGKAALFKKFGGLNAFPIAIKTQDVNEFINTVINISPSFGGINLEDISAPRCFEIEERLKQKLNIPVFHDDQHGTAIVVLAGLINSLKIVNKKAKNVKVIVNGVGAAGIAIIKLLNLYGFKNIIACDTKGAISRKRKDLTPIKKEILKITNKENLSGNLCELIKNRDIFLGVSAPNLLNKKMVTSMKKDPIIFAMANPIPEILPNKALEYGAKIVATGSSQYPNQINNVLVFPGIFKGAIEKGVKQITDEMKINASIAIAKLVKRPNPKKIIPNVFNKNVAKRVAEVIK